MTTVKLRDDLFIERRENDGAVVYTVSDPISGDEFEFGEEEHYLIGQIAEGVKLDEIADHFQERFGRPLRLRQVEAFVERLRLWGLIDRITAVPGPEETKAEISGSADQRYETDLDEIIVNDDAEADAGLVEGQSYGAKSTWRPDRAGVLQQPVRYKALWHDPRWIYFLGRVFQPVKYLVPLIAVVLLVATTTVLLHLHLVEQDFERFWKPWTLIQHLLFGFLTVNLASKVTAGATCTAYGGSVPSFGIHLALGIVPRFHCVLDGWDNMEKRQMVWTLASPILMKLTLFSVGALLWFVMRNSGTQLPMLGYVIASVSLISLLMSGNPLGTGDGYAVMSAILEQANLRGKSLRALFRPFLPKRMKVDLESSRLGALRLYGLLTIAYFLSLLGLIIYFSAIWLESRFEGTGVLIFLLLLLAMLSQIFQRTKTRGMQLAGGERSRSVKDQRKAPANGMPNQSQSRRHARVPADHRAGSRPSRRFPWGWVIMVVMVLVSFFIPYDYETGGSVEIAASDRREIYSESPGIVEEVLVDGDRWVTAGTVIARMSMYRESGQVESISASIKREQAKLEELLTTPRKEEVALAEKQYEAARVRERFARSRMARMEELHKDGNVSTDEYDEAKRSLEVAVVATAEMRENLALVKEGPHPQEIEAKRAEIARLEAELEQHKERLKRTQLVATIDGRLESLNLNELMGKFLDDGDLYTAIIDDRFLRADVQIPESDVPLVDIGDGARIKLWAYPERLFRGEVVAIEPVVEQQSFGRVAKVAVQIQNRYRLLKPGMTGYGKIMGKRETVGEAFTHRLVRFFKVEMWSWIP